MYYFWHGKILIGGQPLGVTKLNLEYSCSLRSMKLRLLFLALAVILNSCFARNTFFPRSSIVANMKNSNVETSKISASAVSTPPAPKSGGGLPPAVKLIVGAGGIYAAFLYYGTLQEDVFHYVAPDGSKFKAAWFLQALGESLTVGSQIDLICSSQRLLPMLCWVVLV